MLALAGAIAVAGCNAPSAQENAAPAEQAATETSATDQNAAATNATETDATPKVAPKKTYRVTTVDESMFGPDAPPKMKDAYLKAMKKARVAPPPAEMKVPDKVTIQIETNRGPMTLELDAKAAPLHVKSFVYLAQKGYFDGTTFHRHAALLGGDKGYIIQGGDPLSKDANAVNFAGMGGPGYEIPRERNTLTHEKFVIAAARTDDPDTASSGFYITQDAVPFLDEGEGYTVFGKVVSGEDAAMKLKKGDILQKVTVENRKEAPKK